VCWASRCGALPRWRRPSCRRSRPRCEPSKWGAGGKQASALFLFILKLIAELPGLVDGARQEHAAGGRCILGQPPARAGCLLGSFRQKLQPVLTKQSCPVSFPCLPHQDS